MSCGGVTCVATLSHEHGVHCTNLRHTHAHTHACTHAQVFDPSTNVWRDTSHTHTHAHVHPSTVSHVTSSLSSLSLHDASLSRHSAPPHHTTHTRAHIYDYTILPSSGSVTSSSAHSARTPRIHNDTLTTRTTTSSTLQTPHMHAHTANIANPNENSAVTYQTITLEGVGPGRRAGHSCTVFDTRKCLIFGGSYGSEYLSDLYILDTDPSPVATVTHVSPLHTLVTGVEGYSNSEEFSDVTFVVEGKPVFG